MSAPCTHAQTSMHHAQKQAVLHISVTRFCYKPLVDKGPYQYKLDCIKQSKPAHHLTMPYPLANIKSASLRTVAKKAITHFNQLYLPQCNSMSLQFQFGDDVFSPNAQGQLYPVSGAALTCISDEDNLCDWKSITTSELAVSAMSMIHSLDEEPTGFYHAGISLVPSCTVSIPIWITDETLGHWLHRWQGEFMPRALHQSMVTMAFCSGDTRIYSLSQSPQDAAKFDKWLSSSLAS